MNEPSTHFLESSLATFRRYKQLAERAMTQLSDEQLHRPPAPGGNSVAVVVKHMAGNMRSRWTDFLTTDGEKPDRHRDDEFVDDVTTREQLLARWERGWQYVFDAVGSLTPDDLPRIVTIRGREHTVLAALHRQFTHYAYHVGQIVLLARMQLGADWEYLSVPPGGSEEYLRQMLEAADPGES